MDRNIQNGGLKGNNGYESCKSQKRRQKTILKTRKHILRQIQSTLVAILEPAIQKWDQIKTIHVNAPQTCTHNNISTNDLPLKQLQCQ
jgi:hypothetical protein